MNAARVNCHLAYEIHRDQPAENFPPPRALRWRWRTGRSSARRSRPQHRRRFLRPRNVRGSIQRQRGVRGGFLRICEGLHRDTVTNLEQENLLRATFEKICRATTDPATIGRRTLAYAQALDCPSAKRMTPAVLAKRLGISRQAVYRQVDKCAHELAEIKGDLQKPG